MMGRQSKVQNKLFYTAINLEQRVRKNHILRKVKRNIDVDFIYNEVKDKYGINGNEYVAAAGTCNRCQLKKQCTKAKSGRTLKRHVRQDDLDSMLKQASSPESN